MKDDTVAALFAHSLTKQPKCRTSHGREQIASKQQLCEDGFYNNEFLKSFEIDESTKGVQEEPQCTFVSCMISLEVRSFSTQVELVMNDFGVQFITEQFDYVNKELILN